MYRNKNQNTPSYADFKLNVLRNIIRGEKLNEPMTKSKALQEFKDDFNIDEPNNVLTCILYLYDRLVIHVQQAEEIIPKIQTLSNQIKISP